MSLIVNLVAAVIFDMDGVIVDSEPLHIESFNEIIAQYDAVITPDDFKPLVGRTQPEIFAAVKERFGIEESIESLMARKQERYLRLVETKIEAMPGLYELVDWLKALGIKMGIASASPLKDIQTVLRCIRLEGAFDAVLSAVNLLHGKPHPDIFLLTAKELGVLPGQCVVLEDSERGVEAARRAGMTRIAMPNFFTRHHDFSAADSVVESLFEAKQILDSLSLFSAPLDSLIWGLTLCSPKPNLGRFAVWVSEKPGFSEKPG
ncbi:MAG: hypothetical protein DRJ03_17080, partial [Chloroflexi bacterium]